MKDEIAHSLFTVEKFYKNDADERVIEGIATTPTPDRVKDVVEPSGVTFKNPAPLLLQHNHAEPVGEVTFHEPTKSGVRFTAKIAQIEEEGPLKTRCDTAWQSIKAGLVKGVSIGFRPLEYEPIKSGGMRFTKSEVFELSLVTIPANADATIQIIKSYDQESLNTTESYGSENDSKTIIKTIAIDNKNKKGNISMSISEQIKQFEDKLAQLNEKMDEVVAKSMSEARTLDEDETKSYDEVVAEIKSVSAHLERLKEMEALAQNRAKSVEVNDNSNSLTVTSFNAKPVETKSVEKGLGFAKFVKILAQSQGNLSNAERIAKSCGDVRVYNAIAKAADAGTTTSTNYSALVEYQTLESEFVELLRPATVLGAVNSWRSIPFNVRIAGQTGATQAGWVGEAQKKPVTEASFNATTHGWKKIAGIVVLSDELIRDSSPSADRFIRDDLVRTIASEIDSQFILPSRSGSSAAPASITSGVAAVPATGIDAAALRADVQAMFKNMIAANLGYTGAVFIMSEAQALMLQMMINPVNGNPEYAGMQGDSKTLFGLPVITSEIAGDNVVLVKPSEIYLSRGAVTIDSSNQAAITLATGGLTSMYETNSVAIRAEQYVNWSRRRDVAVQYISGANYGGVDAAE
ncbi:phage major capsid protein [Salinicola sp. V024]|uniref:phage major capsid protein n=1 Tax=Salinicola sp. V024 TaxID=3459609 RepID=UPI004043D9D2